MIFMIDSELAGWMHDIIDTGAIVRGEATIERMGESILNKKIEIVSGAVRTKAESNRQDDFILWKRGVSL